MNLVTRTLELFAAYSIIFLLFGILIIFAYVGASLGETYI